MHSHATNSPPHQRSPRSAPTPPAHSQLWTVTNEQKIIPKGLLTFGNLAIAVTQPHLWINGKIICWKVHTNLRNAIVVPPYRHYLQQKLGWTMGNMNNVHWTVLTSLLASFQQEDQQCLVLFLHNKLPLQASPMHPHYGSTLCPSCQWEPEDKGHFLACTYPECTALFHTLHQTLSQLSQKLQLHPCILTALWLGMITIQTNSPYPDVVNDIIPPMWHPIQLQTCLGWNQLYCRCVSCNWAQAISTVHPT